jgi:hypothetical protein
MPPEIVESIYRLQGGHGAAKVNEYWRSSPAAVVQEPGRVRASFAEKYMST